MSTSSAVFQKVCKDRWRSFGFLVTCSQFFKNVFDSPTFTLLLSDSKTDQASFLDLFLPCCWFDNAHSLCSAFVQFHTETVCVVHLWLFHILLQLYIMKSECLLRWQLSASFLKVARRTYRPVYDCYYRDSVRQWVCGVFVLTTCETEAEFEFLMDQNSFYSRRSEK